MVFLDVRHTEEVNRKFFKNCHYLAFKIENPLILQVVY